MSFRSVDATLRIGIGQDEPPITGAHVGKSKSYKISLNRFLTESTSRSDSSIQCLQAEA